MSDHDDEELGSVNDNLVLICGKPASGKSASLMYLDNPEGVLYLNCENGKKLPFRSKFEQVVITDPMDVYDAFDQAEEYEEVHTIVIDTFTYLMDMYETKYVVNSTDGRSAWGTYAQYAKKLFSHYIAKSSKNVIILAHTTDVLSEEDGVSLDTLVKVKGSLMNTGVESFFSCVVAAKKMTLKDLKQYENPLLVPTEDDEIVGYKHVFQTRLTKKTKNERLRSALYMWECEETFIDNNAQLVINRLHEFYDE